MSEPEYWDEDGTPIPRTIECSKEFYVQLAEHLLAHERFSPEGGGLVLYTPGFCKLTFKAKES